MTDDTSPSDTDTNTDTDAGSDAAADTVPPLLEEDHSDLRSALADASRLLCCLDFDGTLAPIVEEPDAAAPTAANETAVQGLANESAITTAIVSGRALTDVRERIAGPAIYAGNHGLELERNGAVAVHPVARKRATRIERVCAILETVLEPIPNTRIENKRLTGTVHLRTVPPAARPVVERLTRSVVDRVDGDALELSTGKRILELGPSIPWGKGNAVELIAADEPAGTLPIYIGDDVTDESAFRAIEPAGIGIRVGGPEPSAASYRVSSPDDVATVLEWLGDTGVELLAERQSTPAPSRDSLSNGGDSRPDERNAERSLTGQ